MLVVSLSNKKELKNLERVKLSTPSGEIYVFMTRDGSKNKLGFVADKDIRIEREYFRDGKWQSNKEK